MGQVVRDDICSRQDISAVSVGGGPGTEAIALMDILGDYQATFSLSFDNLDLEKSWKAIYTDLTRDFAKRTANVRLRTKFTSLDLRSYADNLKSLHDIAFVSWFLSEVGKQDIPGILSAVKGLIKLNGFQVIVDRFEDDLVKSIAAALTKVRGLILKEHDRQIGHCGVTFPDDIRDAFQVRLIADTAYWVLQPYLEEF